MLDSYIQKLDYMKSISEQAEMNGLVDVNILPDKIELTLKNKKIIVWFKTEQVEELSL